MFISKSDNLSEKELIEFALDLSTKAGGISEKLLHWDFGPVMTMKFDPQATNYLFSDEAVPFHWDGAFHHEPLKLLFYCTESEGRGGETLFTNTELIWESLSESEKNIALKTHMIYRTKKLAHYGGEIKVSLVNEHPLTGKTILRMAERVETALNPVELVMSNQGKEADEFYRFLKNKLYDPRYLYQHHWEKGDLVVVDNFTYLHGRKPLGSNLRRSFKRIQIL